MTRNIHSVSIIIPSIVQSHTDLKKLILIVIGVITIVFSLFLILITTVRADVTDDLYPINIFTHQ